jgi:hypothetical protein
VSISAIYRLCIWLPLVVPAALVTISAVSGQAPMGGLLGEVLTLSLIYGGVPYAALAGWGSWWISGRPESEIRRMMFRAPVLMAALYIPLALGVGVLVGGLRSFAALAAFGAVVIVALGYGYVGLTLVLRQALGPRAGTSSLRASV